jgi:lipopolysaccharide/colanic/teichoic acid biosynthesis glycosyltransferase
MNVKLAEQSRVSAVPLGTKAKSRAWRPSTSTLRIRLLISILSLDIGCILIGYIVAAAFREAIYGDANWLPITLALVPTFLLAALNNDSYTAKNLQDPFRSVATGLQAYAMAIATVIFMAFCFKASMTFPRAVVALGSLFAMILLACSRYLFICNTRAIIGGNPFSIVLLCDGDQPAPEGDFSIVIATDAHFDPDLHDPVMYDRLAQSLAGADRVVVACHPDRRMAWSQALKGANIQSELLMPELTGLAPLGLGAHGNVATIIVANGPLIMFDRFVKRSFDIASALGAMLVLAPIFALVALAVKYDSPGPVFFKQVRIGRGNQMFRMMKFRSMRVDDSDGAGDRSTSRGDDRITRVGRVIRSTSIDELPQLLNVLLGDMSIVGPRPHALGSRAADKLFWEVDERYWHRHAAKPGLTGLAQIRGYRGATMFENDLRIRLQADLEYLENWSIWRDLKIIFLTFRVLLHRNAFLIEQVCVAAAHGLRREAIVQRSLPWSTLPI